MKVDVREFLTALGELDQHERDELIKEAGSKELSEENFLKTLESRISKRFMPPIFVPLR